MTTAQLLAFLGLYALGAAASFGLVTLAHRVSAARGRRGGAR